MGAVAVVLWGHDPHLNPDSHAFEALARSLLSGQGLVYREAMFPSLPMYAFRSPGYSVFLALGLWLGGVTATVALQGAMHGVGAVLVGDLAGRWGGKVAAWIAFTLRFAWLSSWYFASQFLSETLFEFTFILAVWLAVRAGANRSTRWAIAAGVVATICMLTRPTGLGPAAVVAVWLALRFPRGAVAFALAALVTWAPWPIRNYIRLHAFVPFQSMGGVALYDSHSEQDPIVAWTFMSENTHLGEVGFDRHFQKETLDLIRREPWKLVQRMTRAIVDFTGPIMTRRNDVWLHRFAMLAALPALL